MANSLTFEQSATILNELVSQATGRKTIAPVDESQFVAVAHTGLLAGYDQLDTAISITLSNSIFSIRPYFAKFKGLKADKIRFGNITRKLTAVDRAWEDDERFTLQEGEPIDHYVVHKPTTIQVNFYGGNVYAYHYTIYKDQLDQALSSSEEFGRFWTMIVQEISNKIEQTHELTARNTLCNFIAGKVQGDADNVIHLVSKYNDETGAALTTETVKNKENWFDFAQWAFAYIKTVCEFMTDRSAKYHINITNWNGTGEDRTVMRHTPLDRMKMYLSTGLMNNVSTRVMSNTFNEEFLKLVDFEKVNYWQSIDQPDGINVKPVYLTENGTLTQPEEPVVISDVVGVIFDEDAIGWTSFNEYTLNTPMNAAGAYTNVYYHFTERYWNDFTENAVVLLLD